MTEALRRCVVHEEFCAISFQWKEPVCWRCLTWVRSGWESHVWVWKDHRFELLGLSPQQEQRIRDVVNDELMRVLGPDSIEQLVSRAFDVFVDEAAVMIEKRIEQIERPLRVAV